LNFYYDRLSVNLLTYHIFGISRTNGRERYIEEAFKMYVRLYQREIAKSIEQLYYDILESYGIDTSNISIQVEFPSPDTEQELKLIDTILRRVMVVSQIIAVLGVALPPKWVVNYVFKDLTNAQIQELINYINRVQENIETNLSVEQYLSNKSESGNLESSGTLGGTDHIVSQNTSSSSSLLDMLVELNTGGNESMESIEGNVETQQLLGSDGLTYLLQQAKHQPPNQITNNGNTNKLVGVNLDTLRSIIELGIKYLEISKQGGNNKEGGK